MITGQYKKYLNPGMQEAVLRAGIPETFVR